MKRFTAYVVTLIILIIAASLVAIFAPKPEETTAVSADGVLTLFGLTRDTQPFSIDLSNQDGGEFLENTFYIVEPRGIVLEVPALLTFDVSSFEREVDVFWYAEDFMMWEELATARSASGELSIEIDRLGSFALGSSANIIAPTFAHQYDELLNMAPSGAVGFEMATGYSIEGSPMLFIDGTERVGGCAGIVGRSNTEERTMLSQDLIVPVEGIDTLVTFSFVAEWFVSSDVGCSEGKVLEIEENL